MNTASTVVLTISAITFVIASVGFWYTMPLVHKRTKLHPHAKSPK